MNNMQIKSGRGMREYAFLGTTAINACMMILAIFTSISPYWLWSYHHNVGEPYFGSEQDTTDFGMGTFVISHSRASFPCEKFDPKVTGSNETNRASCEGWVNYQSIRWRQIKDENALLCGTGRDSIFQTWGEKYHLCMNGVFCIPDVAMIIQSFTVFTVIFLGASVYYGAFAPARNDHQFYGQAFFFTLLSSISAIIAFTKFHLWQLVADLRWDPKNTYMPFYATDSDGKRVIIMKNDLNMTYGPGFICMVLIFALTAINAIIQLCANAIPATPPDFEEYGDDYEEVNRNVEMSDRNTMNEI